MLLPALEGMAQQLQLGSLAAAVQAVPGLRAVVQHAVGTLPQPPAPPEDWSRPAAAHWIICVKRNCVDCPAVRSFLEDARESERRFEMDRKRLGHFARCAARCSVRAELGGWLRAETVEARMPCCALSQTCMWIVKAFGQLCTT